MATAYSYNTNTSATAGDWFSDTFLGTAKQQYKQNLAMLNEQNRFSEYMANTAYQRGMEDMEQAGINPMIMYANNGGAAKASAPTSNSMSAGNVDPQNSVFGKMINGAAKTLLKKLDNTVNPKEKSNTAFAILKNVNLG